MGIQGPEMGVVFNGVEAIGEIITDTQSDCFLLSNELSGRINGFDIIEVVPLNPVDHHLQWQQKVNSALVVKLFVDIQLEDSKFGCF